MTTVRRIWCKYNSSNIAKDESSLGWEGLDKMLVTYHYIWNEGYICREKCFGFCEKFVYNSSNIQVARFSAAFVK